MTVAPSEIISLVFLICKGDLIVKLNGIMFLLSLLYCIYINANNIVDMSVGDTGVNITDLIRI